MSAIDPAIDPQRLAQFGIRGSMSRKANCWDNARPNR
jgi:hypothetical protein